MPGSTTLARGNVQLETILQIQITSPASLAVNASVEVLAAVPGVMLGDFIEINKPSHVSGLSIGNVRASAVNQIAVQFVNTTGGTFTGGVTENYIIVVSRFDGAPQTPPSAIA